MLNPSTVDRLAETYAKRPGASVLTPLFNRFAAKVDELFATIPVPVDWARDKQPFETSGQMRRHCEKTGRLLMYAGPSCLGVTYDKHRAVHDWYGHVVPGLPFGVDGELAAYRIHQVQYPAEFHPIIFSDVVLHNAYFECNGAWWPEEKWVLINDKEVL